jgi:molybdopterin converting factor subunit 1
MRVRVRLFAQLRELAGAQEFELDVPLAIGATAPTTVRDVWAALAARTPPLAAFEKSVSCAVNAEYARMSAPVKAGDDVAFLPPVSGG